MSYSEKNIKHLSTVEAIRKVPGMYIGPTDSNGVFQIIKEALDNAIDEFSANRASTIQIKINKNDVIVMDDGAGIPVGNVETIIDDKKVTISALSLILTKSHAGGKFDDNAYKASIGTHGVGLTAANALSSRFAVWTMRRGKCWTTAFSQGKEVKPVRPCTSPSFPPLVLKKGTMVRIMPDKTIFDKGSKIVPKIIVEWAEMASYLNEGIKIVVHCEKESKTFYHKNGLRDLLTNTLEKIKVSKIGKPIHPHKENLDVALQFTDYDGTHLFGYTNASFNSDGGKHVDSVYKALQQTLKPYMNKKDNFRLEDLREGLVGTINYRISNPKFSSQTKEKLVDTRVADPCLKTMVQVFSEYFKANRTTARAVCKRAVDLRKMKQDFIATKKAGLEIKNVVKKGLMPGKFAEARSCPPEKRETFIVEGDSASGPAKQVRNHSFQEVLPLSGKFLNAARSKVDQVFASESVRSIMLAIGYNPSYKNPYRNLRTGKIILLSDPDPDGHHINVLILALISVFFPQMFADGKVYMVRCPRCILPYKDKNYYADSVAEMEKVAPKQANKSLIQVIKGLGQLNAHVLKDIAFDVKTRKLIKITKPSSDNLAKFIRLMSDDVEARKELLGI